MQCAIKNCNKTGSHEVEFKLMKVIGGLCDSHFSKMKKDVIEIKPIELIVAQ